MKFNKELLKIIVCPLSKEQLVYDEKNNYSEIFSQSMTTFRKIVSLSIPSRILIN